jgi:hypothetical protein
MEALRASTIQLHLLHRKSNNCTPSNLLPIEYLIEIIFTMSTFGCSSCNLDVTLVGALSNDSIDQLMGTPTSDRICQCQAVKQFPQIKVLQGAKGKCEMSRQQWEDIKPFIQRIYIDENKPFPYLAHILRTEHGFEPT